VLWNSFKLLVADYAAAEKSALFHDTAARVYRLAMPDPPQALASAGMTRSENS
jgi:hypothetical protein